MEFPLNIKEIIYGITGLAKARGMDSYFSHGIQKKNEKYLGKKASHGCMRVSPTNILDLLEKYLEAGSEFIVTDNKEYREKLETRISENPGFRDYGVEAGREYFAVYMTGEMGVETVLRDGKTAKR